MPYCVACVVHRDSLGYLWILWYEARVNALRASSFSSFPRSATNRRLVSKAHASPLHAYSTRSLPKLPSWKVSTDSLISRAMKSHTNERTVRGRPTLKDVFATGRSASLTRDQFTSEHFEWIYQESCQTVIPKEPLTGAINSSTW